MVKRFGEIIFNQGFARQIPPRYKPLGKGDITPKGELQSSKLLKVLRQGQSGTTTGTNENSRR